MAQTSMTRHESRTPATQAEVITVPDVDIREDGKCIRLLADMPGVDSKSVDVTVENNVLTIEGHAHTEAPTGYEQVGEEYRVGKYRRDFTLSEVVDTDAIKARVVHGVLELTLPKRDQARTRKVEITG